jgi:hypothetical protein
LPRSAVDSKTQADNWHSPNVWVSWEAFFRAHVFGPATCIAYAYDRLNVPPGKVERFMKRIIAVSVSWALLSGVPAAHGDENAVAFQTVSGEFQQPDPILDYARQNARPARESSVTPILSQEAPDEEAPVAPEPPPAVDEEMADVAPPDPAESEAPADEAPAAEESDECGADKDECGCDKKKIEAAKKAAASAYKPLYYDNDFSYIDDPCYKGCLLADNF